MKQVMEFLGPVENGVLPNNLRQSIALLLRGLEGKVVKVAISEHKALRSGNQNAYYWSVIVPHWKELFRDGGEIVSNEEAHSYLVRHIGKLERTLVGPDGKVHTVTPSTSELDTKQFTDFIEICRVEAAKYGRNIPAPAPAYKGKGNDNAAH